MQIADWMQATRLFNLQFAFFLSAESEAAGICEQG
jgi:hypothetical protein